MTPMAYHTRQRCQCFTRKTNGFTRKTDGFTRKRIAFTRKTLAFTRKTVIYDTNGLPYTSKVTRREQPCVKTTRKCYNEISAIGNPSLTF